MYVQFYCVIHSQDGCHVCLVPHVLWYCRWGDSCCSSANTWTHLLIIPYSEFYIYGIVYGQGELGRSVGIVTGYGLDGPGIESRWGQDFPHLSTLALGSTQPPVQWYRVFPGVKSSWGVMLTPHPFLVPWPGKSRAIPVLPLWAVRPVQSLSACTRVTFTFAYMDKIGFWWSVGVFVGF